MREILFRGKRIDNGEWVEGCFGQHTRLDAFIIDRPYPTLDGEIAALAFYKVDPETVGQYTGLQDKNGKQIFEGDLVRYTERKLNGSDVPCVNPVEFAEGGWAIDCWFLSNWLYDGKDGNIQLDVIEVIGNIHDNPELLGGNDND